MINVNLLLILVLALSTIYLSQIECCTQCSNNNPPACGPGNRRKRDVVYAETDMSAGTIAIAGANCAAGQACESTNGRVKRSTLNEMRILLNTTYNFQNVTANMNKDPSNLDLLINNITLGVLGVSQIIFGNDSNKLQIIFIQSEESIDCNYVVTSLREFAKLNPSIVGAEILCAGKNQSVVVKGPNDGNVSPTTTSPKTTTTKRPDPKCWWWIWKGNKKHRRPCWWWWYPNKHDQNSWADFSEEEEAQNYDGWPEQLQDSYGPKSHVMHGGGRQRRQVSLPTESSLLAVIGVPIPYQFVMGFYDPVAVQNDTFYIATQLYLSAAGLSTRTYLEDDFGNLQIQFYFPKRSEMCCNVSKKAQSLLDNIDPFYEYSVRLYCGLERPFLFKSQIPVENTCLCPSGWTYFNGSCYLLNTNVTGMRFSSAESYCQNNFNAHLPSVHSAKEQEFISNLLAKGFNRTSDVKRIWSGLTLHRNATIFGASWSDGSPVDFGNPVGMTPGTYPWGTSPDFGPEPQKNPAETQVAMAARDRSLGRWVDRIPQTPADGILCRK